MRKAGMWVAVLAIALAIAATGTAAAATVTNPNDSGTGSLRWAIANTPSGGTIDFGASLSGSTIRLSSELAIEGKALAIEGPGSGDLAISGEKACRVFLVDDASSLTLSGLTVENGHEVRYGAGVYSTGFLAMRDCIVTNCVLDVRTTVTLMPYGAGVYASRNPKQSLVMNSCAITSNLIVYAGPDEPHGPNGAGLYAGGEVTVRDCEFSENATVCLNPGVSYPCGIGMSATSLWGVVERCVFRNNVGTSYATEAGEYFRGTGLGVRYIGDRNRNVQLVVRDCRFTGNRAEFEHRKGSAVVCYASSFYSPLVVENCLIDNNHGRAVVAHSNDTYYAWWRRDVAMCHLRNTTITGNVSDSILVYLSLDAVYAERRARLSHCTIANNTVTDANAVYVGGCGASDLIEGCIISGNVSGAGAVELSGGPQSLGYNLVDSCAGSPLDGPGDMVGVDPMLGPLADNGGPTMTMAPLSGSPLIDAIPYAHLILPTDQRGHPRPGGNGAEIGAFEFSNATRAMFSRVQRIYINQEQNLWTGVWSYGDQAWLETMDNLTSFGWWLDYYLPPRDVLGLYLYDYDSGAFLDGMQVWHQVWN